MSYDKMPGRERAAQREFSGQDRSSNDACELACVIARIGWMRSAHTEEVEHCGLRLEDCAATNRTYFDRGHRNGYLKISTETICEVSAVAPNWLDRLTSS
jgi:hypothetical protein